MTTTCVHCRAAVGGETGEIPMRVGDEHGEDHEVWCPQCFVWRRALLEPHRFHWHSINAITCARCGVISIDFGRGACSQCLGTAVMALPPKPVVVVSA